MKRNVFMAILAVMVSTTIGVGGVVFADQTDGAISTVECETVADAREGELEEQETGIEINEENFPDSNFRDFLKSNDTLSIKEGEGEETKFYVNVDVTDMKICISNISDITGIEYFDNLTNLVISGQTSNEKSDGMMECLDLTKIPNLQSLTVENTTIQELNLRKSVNLKSLTVLNNDIENLDLTECTYIKTVIVRNNKNLKSVNASDCTYLIDMDVSDSVSITKLEIKGCTSIKTLMAGGCNNLKYIDVLMQHSRDMKSLKILDLEGTSIDGIDIVGLTNLETLNIKKCQSCRTVSIQSCFLLENLFWDGCENVEDIILYKIAVKELDISNLHCVKKLHLEGCLDLKRLNANNCLKLNEVFFNELPDIEILELQNTRIETLNIDDFHNIMEVDVSGSFIESFCANNNFRLKKFVARECPYLETVDLSNSIICKLEVLDVGGSKELSDLKFFKGDEVRECCLEKIDISGTLLTNLDVEGLRYLVDLKVDGCKLLWYLRVNNCTAILNLEINDCENLTDLIINDQNNIEKIILSGTLIEELDIKNFTKLKELEIIDCVNLLNLDIEGCSNLYILSIYNDNQLETIKVSDAIIGSLYFRNLKGLKELEINNCEKLQYLDICDCPNLTSIDVDENNRILSLNLSGVSIEKLDLRKFTNLNILGIQDCPKLSCVNTENCEYLMGLSINNCSKLVDLFINGDFRLVNLNLNGVSIEKLDLSGFENLVEVDVSGCSSLLELSFSGEINTKIKRIDISKTSIKEFIVFQLATLEEVIADECNKLLTINTDGCKKLTSLSFAGSNNLRCVKISGSSLKQFEVVGYNELNNIVAFDCNELKEIKATNCSKLKSIGVSTSGSMKIITKNCPLLSTTFTEHGDVSVVFK